MSKSSRSSAIKRIIKLNPDALFITSAGYISRSLYEINDNNRNFYMMGSLGCAVGFGIGLAMNTNKEVVVIVGDGEILMGLSSLVLTEKLKLSNLSIYILDNNEYQSTGGQPTCSEYLPRVGFNVWTIPIEDNYVPPRIKLSCKEIKERFYDEVNGI